MSVARFASQDLGGDHNVAINEKDLRSIWRQRLSLQRPARHYDVYRAAGRPPMPVPSFEDVDGGDAKGLFGLADLPVLDPAVAFQVVAEPAGLIRQRFVRRLAREETAHPPHEARSNRGARPAPAVDPLADLVHRLTGADVHQCPSCQVGRMRVTGVLAPTAGTTQTPPFADSS